MSRTSAVPVDPVPAEGAPLAFNCPRCGEPQSAPNRAALERIRRAGGCQACRALAVLRGRPFLLHLYVEFWRKAGFPDSASWLRCRPASSAEAEPS